MVFTKEFLENKIFRASDSCFDRIPLQTDAENCSDAAILQPNGDYLLRIGAKNARTVDILPLVRRPHPRGLRPLAG